MAGESAVSNVVALGKDCAVCLARTNAQNDETMTCAEVAEHCTEVLLVLVLGGNDLEQMRRDLCFLHRANIEDAVRKLTAPEGEGA